MTKELANSGFETVHYEESETSQATVVVVGVARSGTTMMAKVLHNLGILMEKPGENSVVLEDKRFWWPLERENDERAFLANVKEQNALTDFWGWKRPQAYQYANRFLPFLRNPKMVTLFRDSLAVSKRSRVSSRKPKETWFNFLEGAVKQTSDLARFAIQTETPDLLVSYEKAITNPEAMIEVLTNYVGIKPTETQKRAALKSIQNGDPRYLEASAVK